MLRTRHGLHLPETLAELVDPSRTALLVYDMQVGVCRQLPDGDRIVAAIFELLGIARACGMRVAYSRHLSLPSPWLGATQTRMALRWQRQTDPDRLATPFARGAAAFEIVPALRPDPADLVIDKIAMSAFEGTYLATALRDCAVTSVVVCGIATEIGIEPTVRHAADLGFVPLLVTDACGAGDPEAARRTIASLAFAGDATLVTGADIATALRRPGPAAPLGTAS